MNLKSLFLLFCSLSSMTLHAQNGIYVKPSVGVGLSSVISNYDHPTSTIYNYNLRMGVGYERNKWRIETGVRYFTTGYKNAEYLVFENNINTTTGVITGSEKVNNTYTFTHIAVPVSIGYKIPLTKKLSLVPMAGALVSYNLKCHLKSVTDIYTYSVDYPQEEFERTYNRINVWGSAAINLEYKVGRRLKVAGGLQTDFMLNTMINSKFYSQNYHQYNYDGTINIGVKWHLGHVNNWTSM